MSKEQIIWQYHVIKDSELKERAYSFPLAKNEAAIIVIKGEQS